MQNKNMFEVTLEEAFEMGKLIGKRDVLEEFDELAILDLNFKTYIKARLKSLDETSEIMKKYKILMKVGQ